MNTMRPATASFDAAASATQVVVRQAWASAGSGTASFSGSAVRDAQPGSTRPGQPANWHVLGIGQFEDFDPLPWWPGASQSSWRAGGHRLDGQVSADLHWQVRPAGSANAANTASPATVATGLAWLAQLDGWAQVKLGRSAWAGMPVTGQARLERRGGAAQLQAALQSGATKLDLTAGHDGSRAPHERLNVSVASPDLAGMAPLMRQIELWLPGAAGVLPWTGQIDAQAEVSNEADGLRSAGRLQAKGVHNALGQVGAVDLNWTVGWAKKGDSSLHTSTEPLLLSVKAAALVRGDQRLDRLDLDVSGSLADHRLAMLVESPARPPGWTEVLFGPAGNGTRVELNGRGSWASTGAVAHRWSVSGLQLQAAGREAATSGNTVPDRGSRGPAKPWLRAQTRFRASGDTHGILTPAGLSSMIVSMPVAISQRNSLVALEGSSTEPRYNASSPGVWLTAICLVRPAPNESVRVTMIPSSTPSSRNA